MITIELDVTCPKCGETEDVQFTDTLFSGCDGDRIEMQCDACGYRGGIGEFGLEAMQS